MSSEMTTSSSTPAPANDTMSSTKLVHENATHTDLECRICLEICSENICSDIIFDSCGCLDPSCGQTYTTECNHSFHHTCLTTWILQCLDDDRHGTCPHCRRILHRVAMLPQSTRAELSSFDAEDEEEDETDDELDDESEDDIEAEMQVVEYIRTRLRERCLALRLLNQAPERLNNAELIRRLTIQDIEDLIVDTMVGFRGTRERLERGDWTITDGSFTRMIDEQLDVVYGLLTDHMPQVLRETVWLI